MGESLGPTGPMGVPERFYGATGPTGPPEFVETGGLRLAKGEPPGGFGVSEKNWNRWGGHLKQLQDPIPFAKDAVLLAVGLIPTTVISLIAWIPNYAQLPANAQADYWWVTPVMLAVAIAAVVIATVMWLTRGAINARVKRDADLLYDDMDHVHHFSDG